MDHVVYLDAKANELEKLLAGEKTMIIRGAAGRKLPYGRVEAGDVLHFMNSDAEGLVRARATVRSVFNSEKMSKEESAKLVEDHQDKLQLTRRQFKRWAGKRYLVLIGVGGSMSCRRFLLTRATTGTWMTGLRLATLKT